MSDANYGPHETYCDIRLGISLACNCIASTYIERIEELEKKLAMTAETLDAVELKCAEQKKEIKELKADLRAARKDRDVLDDANIKLNVEIKKLRDVLGENKKVKYKIAMHDDPAISGYMTRTLIVTGIVDKYGMFKNGKIHAQTFGKTVGEAEGFAEKLLELLNSSTNEPKGRK